MRLHLDDRCEMLGCWNLATKQAEVLLGKQVFHRRICDQHAKDVFDHPEEYGITVVEIINLETPAPDKPVA